MCLENIGGFLIMKSIDKLASSNRPMLSMDEIISYECHVKGLTADESCHVKNKGTFLGLIEKLDDLKNLGINQLILLPVYDFNENINNVYGVPGNIDLEDECMKNYWGFSKGDYFSIKNKYAIQNPDEEFHEFIYSAHNFGIEVVPMFYFDEDTNTEAIFKILIYWSEKFGVDGFFLNVNPYCLKMLSDSSKLECLKLYNYDIDENLSYTNPERIGIYDYEYRSILRKMLLGYPYSLNEYITYIGSRKKIKRLCSISSHNGFTLYDLYSYCKKHNEANGEFNHDGEEINYSDNSGFEGYTDDSVVNELRIKRIKNALSLLLLTDGVPMLLAGDEHLNSQNGNNNAYCQDNEISWIQYNNDNASVISKYLKSLILLRNSFGNISYDRSRINVNKSPAFEIITEDFLDNNILYNTKCAGFVFAGDDFYLCLMANFDNYSHKLSIPHLPKDYKWSIIARTDVNSDVKYPEDIINNKYILCSNTVYLLIAEGGKTC